MKKVLSIILALTLAFSLLPTFASAETTEDSFDWNQPIVFKVGTPTILKYKGDEANHQLTNGSYYSYGDIIEGDNWKFVMSRQRSDILYKGNVIKTMTNASGNYLQITAPVDVTDSETQETKTYSKYTFALKIPASGIYNISADVYNTKSGVNIKATIHDQKKTDKDPAEKISIGQINNTIKDKAETSFSDGDLAAGPRTRMFSAGIGIPVAKTENWDTATNEAFIDTAIILNGELVNGSSNTLYNFTFTPSEIYSATVAVPANEYKIGDTFTPSVSLNVKDIGDKTYSALDQAGIVLGVKESNAGVAIANNIYTVAKSGEVTFTPTVTVNGKTHDAAPITLSVASNEDEALKEAFKVEEAPVADYVAPSVVSVTVDGAVVNSVKNADGSHKITAPESNKDGANFLYWAKGLSDKKRIVSFSNVIENYVPEEDGANFLIAVYDDYAPTKDEYYNANGQLLATGEEPDLPSMAGYGEASDWKQYEETNIYVAEYNGKTQPDSVTVTVNGNERTVPYGTAITCTANGENFKCWTKTNINGKTEIVSADEDYKFFAWENCSVDAVYEVHSYTGKKMKIVIDSFTAGNDTGIMAEFIGFGSGVIEKGIMWNDEKIAMTKPGSQFSVIADKNGEYKGYAIVENNAGGYTLVTDGSITINDAE